MLNKIKNDLKMAMKDGNDEVKNATRIILGEIPRLNKKVEDITDVDVMGVLKKLKKSEQELLEKAGDKTSSFLTIIESYLPAQISEEVIESWIKENIDFSSLKNIGQAIPMVIKQFGQAVDGKTIKSILDRMMK